MRCICGRKTGRGAAGFTLTELLIAAALSLLLALLAARIFIDGRQMGRFQDESLALQERGRFALALLIRETRRSGAAYGLSGSDGDGENGSDSVVVAYPGAKDCAGAATAGHVRYYIASGGLYCDGDGRASAQPLLEGIEALQLLYGEDVDGDGAVDRYLNAAAAQATMAWPRIVAVQIALLARALEATATTAATPARTYPLLDVVYGPFNDRRLRQVFASTVHLRNR